MEELENDPIQWDEKQVEIIARDLSYLRLQADLELLPRYPIFLEKTYPLGRCKEIRDAVFALLEERLPTATEPGLVLIRNQLTQGRTLNKIWGELRGVYFQNAMVLGNWYFDVSNDTVDPNKPRVEVLPLASSGFSTISSFEQFISVAETYWQVDVYRNDICPALAPFLPLVYVARNGACWVGEAADDMLAVATQSQFIASEQILRTLPPPPPRAIAGWREILANVQYNDFLHQQGDAIAYCQRYRAKRFAQDSAVRDSAVMAFLMLPKTISLSRNFATNQTHYT